ncbi:MAG: exodeoxyribonuclease VII large subunit [Coriobacteriales bacterium]|nr:exodeoxyribonuclease VII large subunit [Coriobacteriales bacterium]
MSPITVTQALMQAKTVLEQVGCHVVGEISEIADKPGYKAIYFTLADEHSALSCLMWRSQFDQLQISLERGMLVEVSGRFTLYAAKGRMNFMVMSMKLAGEGALRMKVAQLAKKLEFEGLMDPDAKLKLPRLPMRIGLVTSPRGKAVHDVLRTLRRRFPLAEVALAGITVEGTNAVTEIIKGITSCVEKNCDVLLLVRGGGSYEDLMPFNDERLARAIAECPIPIVTGIGHEPDTTIADMVSSARASTPTAAAERVVPDALELSARLVALQTRLAMRLRANLDLASARLAALRKRALFKDPNALFASYHFSLEQSALRLQQSIPLRMQADKLLLESQRLKLLRIGNAILNQPSSAILLMAAKLESLSPLAVLTRGYAAAYDVDGKVVCSIRGVNVGDELRLRLRDGILTTYVADKHDETSKV